MVPNSANASRSRGSASAARHCLMSVFALLGFRVEGSKYFDYHHSHADTLDKIDPAELSRCTAVMAVAAYILADMPEKLGEPIE